MFSIVTLLIAMGLLTFVGPVVAAPSFSVGAAAASPSPVAPGASTTITTTVTNTGSSASSILVDTEVYSSTDSQMFQKWTSGLTFAAGQQRSLQWPWAVPTSQPVG